MEAQRADANHATPFILLWQLSTALTDIGIGLAMLTMASVRANVCPTIVTPMASRSWAMVTEQHNVARI